MNIDPNTIDLPRLRGDLREAGAQFGNRTGAAKLLDIAIEHGVTIYDTGGEELSAEPDEDEEIVDGPDDETPKEDGAEASGEEEETQGGNIVPKKYRDRYGPAQHCGDEMATVFKGYVTETDAEGKSFCSPDRLAEIAAQNGANLGKWAHLNIGQQRMNLGNVLRGKLNRGERVEIGTTVWEARAPEDVEEGETASKMG